MVHENEIYQSVAHLFGNCVLCAVSLMLMSAASAQQPSPSPKKSENSPPKSLPKPEKTRVTTLSFRASSLVIEDLVLTAITTNTGAI